MTKTAALALEELFDQADKDGIKLYGVSGYRSYTTQQFVYQNNINRFGMANAEIYSAKPGASEHQTGLAVDVSCASMGSSLSAGFAQTKEGIWLAEHCANYGFIIRYPMDRTDITGYGYEPWHIRYVGKEVAKYLTENDLVLEEYEGAKSYEEWNR